MILPKIETILGQPKHHKAHAWKLIFAKQHTCGKKTSCKYLFWRKISIEGETKYICPQVKAKSEMLIFLDCWPTVVCLLLTGSFPIKTPSTSKDPTTLPRFLPSKSFCCHGNLMFSGNQVSGTLPYIHEQCSNSGWFLLETQGIYPVTTVPISTCSNTRNQQYLTVHREPGLLQNKQMHPERGRAGWEWELSFIF